MPPGSESQPTRACLTRSPAGSDHRPRRSSFCLGVLGVNASASRCTPHAPAPDEGGSSGSALTLDRRGRALLVQADNRGLLLSVERSRGRFTAPRHVARKPAGPNSRIDDAALIAVGAARARKAAIAINPAGDAVLGWNSSRPESLTLVVHAATIRRMRATGPIRTFGPGISVEVAIDNHGRALAAWNDDT